MLKDGTGNLNKIKNVYIQLTKYLLLLNSVSANNFATKSCLHYFNNNVLTFKFSQSSDYTHMLVPHDQIAKGALILL